MTCGWLTSDLSMMLAGKEGKIHFPVPAYLIDHPRGLVLFDTGMHPQCQHDAPSRIGALADLFSVHFREGEDIKSRLGLVWNIDERITVSAQWIHEFETHVNVERGPHSHEDTYTLQFRMRF